MHRQFNRAGITANTRWTDSKWAAYEACFIHDWQRYEQFLFSLLLWGHYSQCDGRVGMWKDMERNCHVLTRFCPEKRNFLFLQFPCVSKRFQVPHEHPCQSSTFSTFLPSRVRLNHNFTATNVSWVVSASHPTSRTAGARGYTSSGPCSLTYFAWVALPGAYAPVNMVLLITGSTKPPLYDDAVVMVTDIACCLHSSYQQCAVLVCRRSCRRVTALVQLNTESRVEGNVANALANHEMMTSMCLREGIHTTRARM